jgi:U3 small nucleolar RNA-associated protein 12
LLYKVYNYQINDGKIFLNNGSDIILLNEERQITNSNDRTQQIELQFPFLIQRNNRDLQVYNYGTFNHLFTIPQKALSCSLFNSGFLMIVESEEVSIWDLAKNEKIHRVEEKWLGCWVKKSKCLLWRENELGIFEVGADAKGRVKMRQSGNKYFEDKITSAMYRHAFDKYAVNLQNSQIYIQYADSNKNCLKLYGHKLPINSFDISSDDALLVTGSTDKDIRFWDLDFGHSIKTLFAHSEPVTAVKFIHETHYVISGSKDGHVKFWDGDTHELIMDLEDNILEIRSLAITTAGDFIIAGGLDGGFRVWKQTNDQTIAGDQAEKNMDKVMIE